jgi:tRNA uridine 5-carboxymethylaminomethyl modification enzyme
MEDSIIPDDVNYEKIKGLLNDTLVKFNTLKPRSLGQALRIPGVTPADISVLMVYLSKLKHVSRGTVDL